MKYEKTQQPKSSHATQLGAVGFKMDNRASLLISYTNCLIRRTGIQPQPSGTLVQLQLKKRAIHGRFQSWLGVAFCLLLCACSPQERDPLVRAGMYAFAQERYGEAIVAFHKALAARADDYEVHHYLARSYLALGKFPQALRAIEHAIELAPQNNHTRAELYEILGIVHTARYTARAYSPNQHRDVQAARAAFEQSIALNPRRATAHYNLGLLHGYRQEVNQAQAAYTAALAADSTLAPAHKKLGKIHREKGFPSEAARAFKKAVRFDPQDAEAHFLLGLAQRDSGDNEAALRALLKATELNPNSPKLRLNLGNVYLRLGRREAGKREMARSESLRQQHRGLHSEISPPTHQSLPIGSARDHYNMGLKHRMAGETDRALLEFRRTVAINPDHKDAHIGLGLLLAEQGRQKQAARSFERAIELAPENPVLHVHLGHAHYQAGFLEGAAQTFAQAAQLDSSLVEPPYMLGLIAAQQRHFEEAARFFARATSLAPQYAKAHFNLGVAHAQLGDFAAARSAYQRFVELDPEDGRGHLYLGDACEALGLGEESQKHRARGQQLLERGEH